MWTFRQGNGLIEDASGLPHGFAYAGRGEGKNNPILQDVRAGCRFSHGEWVPVEGLSDQDYGPLPRGIYSLQAPVDSPKHGKFVMWLTPDPKNEMYHRAEFGWHGDSVEHPGLASEGCIASPRSMRELAWASNDHRVQVIA
ncbi:MAG: hypothetical protein JWQ87_5484 [Candidatus Sulfotelmatobacter sp.]|nr:hypothetical protein [Candidatus Sulfotelmatobacter sp.]